MRFFFYRHSLTKTQKYKLLFVGFLFLLAVFLCIITYQMRPLLSNMAAARVSNVVTKLVAAAVNQTMDREDADYDALVSFEKDDSGHIAAVHSNMAAFNRLQSEILNQVLEDIAHVETRDLSIPLGSLTGSSLLAGRGPRLSVKMQTVGSSQAYLTNEFSSAGINQTRHQILLHVDVYISILLPGFRTATKVSNIFSVAETVIVGNVPESYTHFQSDAPIEENAREHVLNGG